MMGVPVQVPFPSQWSPEVQAFPSLHWTDEAAFETTRHVEVPWQASAWHVVEVHVIAVPTQPPCTHLSLNVHALPSLQLAPSLPGGFEQVPVLGLHTPKT